MGKTTKPHDHQNGPNQKFGCFLGREEHPHVLPRAPPPRPGPSHPDPPPCLPRRPFHPAPPRPRPDTGRAISVALHPQALQDPVRVVLARVIVLVHEAVLPALIVGVCSQVSGYQRLVLRLELLCAVVGDCTHACLPGTT